MVEHYPTSKDQYDLPKSICGITLPKVYDKYYKQFNWCAGVSYLPQYDSLESERYIQKDVLPVNLQSIVFGYCYNQTIEKDVLPPNLQTLVFGKNYNKPLQKYALPPKLRLLIFDEYGHFNETIHKKVLPKKPTILWFHLRNLYQKLTQK